ncbi:MAG: hypothetical protein KGL39_45950 [Patescibacteria group bacterium]|nr:hypothetical protein [Patescibacteria group bacterium]
MSPHSNAEALYVELCEAGIAVYLKADGSRAMACDPGVSPDPALVTRLKALAVPMGNYIRREWLDTLSRQSPADRATTLRYLKAEGKWTPTDAEIEAYQAERKVVA